MRGWPSPDAPPPPAPPGAPAQAAVAKSGPESDWAWAMALLFPPLTLILLTIAWSFLNNSSPQVGWAGFVLVLLALLAVGAVWSVVHTHPDEHRRWVPAVVLPALLVAVPVGLFLLAIMEDMYGTFGFLGIMLGMGLVLTPVAPAYLLLLIVAFIMRRTGTQRGGDRIAQVAGLGAGGGFATAGIIMLFTLRRQEELARQAHDTPGLGVMVLLLVVVLGLMLLRRGS